MQAESAEFPFEVEACPRCPICAGSGDFVYRELRDRVFGVAGKWSMRACSDAACGTYWLDPRPTPSSVPKAYRKYYTHSEWARVPAWIKPIRDGYLAVRYGYPGRVPDTLAWLLAAPAILWPTVKGFFDVNVRWLPGDRKGRILDVGCGSGQALGLLRELGWEVAGVEIDPAAAEVARNKGIPVHAGSLDSAPFAQGSFDAVTLSHVVEHVAQPVGLLEQCRRMLRPGGVLCLATPNVGGRSHRKYGANWYELDPPRHFFVPTASGLARIARDAGFLDISVRSTFRNIEVADFVCRRIAAEGTYTWGDRPTLRNGGLLSLALLYRAPVEKALGLAEGDELVLYARAP